LGAGSGNVEAHRLAFLDFEASSISNKSYPIEVGWVFEDGSGEDFLIRPEQSWTDWSANAQAIHGITKMMLLHEVNRPMFAGGPTC
jgi:DNA polymerase III epsilon subunit-like protein